MPFIIGSESVRKLPNLILLNWKGVKSKFNRPKVVAKKSCFSSGRTNLVINHKTRTVCQITVLSVLRPSGTRTKCKLGWSLFWGSNLSSTRSDQFTKGKMFIECVSVTYCVFAPTSLVFSRNEALM